MRTAIVYGEVSPPGGIEDGVLLLRTHVDAAEVLCSASLVAKNLVLTARHCVAHLVPGPFNCTVRGELIDNPDGAGQLGLDLSAETLELYGGATPRSEPIARGQTIVSTLSDTICLNDIAFVVLDRSLDLPPLPLRLDGPARVGEPVTFVGYGMDETQASTIDFRRQPRRRKADLSIGAVGPDSIDRVTSIPPRTLVLDGPSGCVADSGGPLLDSETFAAVGVYSLLDGESCVDPGVRHEFVHVPPFRAIIDEAFRAAGAVPVHEQPTAEGSHLRDAGFASDAGFVPEAGLISDASFARDASRGPSDRHGSASNGCALARRMGAEPAALLLVVGALGVARVARRRFGRSTAPRRFSADPRADPPPPSAAAAEPSRPVATRGTRPEPPLV